jgi:hypothetical protein
MDMKQALIHGDMVNVTVEDDVYVQPLEWWLDPIQEEYVFRLKKAIYWTEQAARRWHTRIWTSCRTWMGENGYPAVNSEKAIFMARKQIGDDSD